MNKICLFLLLILSGFFSFCDDRRSSYPFISGDTFRDFVIRNKGFLCDETKIDDLSLVKPGDFIFLKSDYIEKFVDEYSKKIENPYILITHNSDIDATKNFEFFLNNKNLIAWFAQNTHINSHPKLFIIPIGIANRYWGHGNIDIFNQLIDIKKKRNNFVYLNFSVATYSEERQKVHDLFATKNYVTLSPGKFFHDYLNDLKISKFVLCPRGNGLDTHRLWESLYMGAIPIVRSSPLDEILKDLPVVIVDNWQEINENFLHKKKSEIKNKKLKIEKIYFDHWQKLLKRTRDNFLNKKNL